MTALMFFRGDRRTELVESAWTNVLQIKPPLPPRPVPQRAFDTVHLTPRVKEYASSSRAQV
jgi:hypothetical protein